MQNQDQEILASLIKLTASAISKIEARLTAVENAAHNIQQTVNMAGRQPLHGRRPIRCLFLVHYVESWDTWADVYEAMREAGDFEPIVATTNRCLVGPPGHYKDEAINHDELARLNVPHLRFNMPNSYEALDIIKAMAPDIIFRQSPWESAIPPGFAAHELTFARLCYVPYAFVGVRRYTTAEDAEAPCSSLQTDQIFHRLCWRIFCETDMHKEMFRKTAARGTENVVCSGYPKFDHLLRAKSRTPFWPIPASGRRRFRLIWAPHHSIKAAWLNFGTFPEMHRAMLDWARTTPDFDIVLKPHPSLFEKLVEMQAMTPQALAAFLAEWKALPNTALVEGGDYGPLFCGSDAMLTDGVSFLFEYPLFEKPLIFLDSGCHVGFNEAGTVAVEAANTVRSFDEARDLCERFRLNEPDPKAALRRNILARIRPYPGQSAQKILDSIREGLSREDNAGVASAAGIR